MPVLIPLACLGALAWFFQLLRTKSGDDHGSVDLRRSLLVAAVAWGALLAGMTELLSLFHALSFRWVLGCWSACLLALILCCYRLARTQPSRTPPERQALRRFDRALLVCVAVIVVVVGVIAVVAPPNNWDSMTYHLSRVAHWVQNRTVAHYPTHILMQLHHNPWAEWAITHFQILAGSDRFANGVQWLAMLGGIVAASLLAKRLGADRRGQILAAVICATIPMGILQGSSTQNDYVLAFWVACAAESTLLIVTKGFSWTAVLSFAGACGLAILTKATAYIYVLPFVLWLGGWAAWQLRLRAWQPAMATAAIILLLNTGHYIRNYGTFDSLLGPTELEPPQGQRVPGKRYVFTNETVGPAALASNVVRNLSLHMGTKSDRLNSAVASLVRSIHSLIRADLNDPRTTWLPFKIQRITYHEDTTGNPAHLLVILLSVVLYFGVPRLRRLRLAGTYLAAIVGGFLLFCLLLKWSPWHARQHLSLFVICSPFGAVVLSGFKRRFLPRTLAVVLIVLSALWVLHNRSRPILGEHDIFNLSREQLRFVNLPGLYEPYLGATKSAITRGYRQIGLITDRDDWEYPFWVLLGSDSRKDIRIEHVNVTNLSSGLAYPLDRRSNGGRTFLPELVISTSGRPRPKLVIDGQDYPIFGAGRPVSAYLRADLFDDPG